MKRYLVATALLTCLLTVGFAFGSRDGPLFPGVGLFLALEIPGMMLRPDAWLFTHPALTGLVTSGLAAIVWVLPVFTAHAIVRRIRRRSRV